MSRTISPHDVIQHMEVPGARGLFVVGCFENRVTVLSQQVRALNLVFALRQCGRLPAGSKVAVVGGGAAGITAAAAATRIGCEVTLLEKKEALLSLLRGNSTRWLHPHIYDWPLEGSERNEADLPLLTWRAGLARDVVVQLEQEWTALPEHSRIRTILNVESIDVQSDGHPSRRLVSWNAPGLNEDTFDVVLFTVGFGLERKIEGIQWSSYWDNDRLHQPVRSSSERHLISGCGDGGLVELLRVRLGDFRHEDVLRDFLSNPLLDSLKAKLLEIEERAKQEVEKSAYIFNEYKALSVPDVLDETIKRKLRRDSSAVLNGLEPRPLTLQSSILNRLLVSRLLFRFDVPYRPGAFSHTREGEHYKVQFKTGRAEAFSHITCRHGPSPSALEEEFQDIWKKCEPMRARNVLDQTRWPLWAKGFFELERDDRRAPPQTAVVNLPRSVGEVTGDSGEREVSRNSTSTTEVIEPATVQERSASVVENGHSKSPVPSAPSRSSGSAKPTNTTAVVLVVGVAWLMFSKDRQAPDVVESPERAPERVVAPSDIKNAVSRIKQGSGPSTTPTAPKPDGVAFAGGEIRTLQQLRAFHRVRPLQQGEEEQVLDYLPPGVFGFVDPSGPLLSGQVRVTSQPAANAVEVHKLTDGQLQIVGYVWDVESRAIRTGRPVNFQLSPQPDGRSQNLVSIPFGRIRSAYARNEQGRFVVGIDLGGSAKM